MQPELPPTSDVESARKSLTFARERLGPRSEALLSRPEAQALVLSRLRGGAALEDAVLGEVHRAAALERALADEFLAYFLGDLLRLGRSMLSARLRRFLDTGDLAQSVLGDLWPELAAVAFESRARFVSLLAKRLSWKAADRARALHRDKRREDLRADAPLDDQRDRAAGPVAELVSREEQDRLILILLRLPERDRELLALHLRGEPLEALMRATDLGRESARKALQRAVRRAREMACHDEWRR